jgi:hypothetical protein
MKGLLWIAVVAYCILFGIAIGLYFRPKFIREGFATVALSESVPKCFLRDAEAQQLMLSLQSEKFRNKEMYEEFELILQKLLCLDADVTGSAAGPYSTYQLPFATSHDIEPVASFVGRCVRNVTRERDLEMVFEKFQSRGTTLLAKLCNPTNQQQANQSFQAILLRVRKAVSPICIAPKANLDMPPGVRDPGYYESDSVKHLMPYEISGGGVQYF